MILKAFPQPADSMILWFYIICFIRLHRDTCSLTPKLNINMPEKLGQDNPKCLLLRLSNRYKNVIQQPSAHYLEYSHLDIKHIIWVVDVCIKSECSAVQRKPSSSLPPPKKKSDKALKVVCWISFPLACSLMSHGKLDFVPA